MTSVYLKKPENILQSLVRLDTSEVCLLNALALFVFTGFGVLSSLALDFKLLLGNDNVFVMYSLTSNKCCFFILLLKVISSGERYVLSSRFLT